jgi:FixJ family two-component response regulator
LGKDHRNKISQIVPRLMTDRKVHVIDDDESVCVLLKNMLIGCGFDVITYNQAYPDVFREMKEPDLLFIDIIMPGMNGLQVLDMLEGHQIKSSVVLMSGAGDVLATAQAFAKLRGLRIIGVLQKPFRLTDLMNILEPA